jgi:spermidine/putrescine transport system ATP-binding protein/putrescine transport system ATP-binding protein
MSAPVPNTLLAAEKVEKRFGGVVAVDGIDLAIAENEFFALLGPSGCGKTTLLRMIAGFETPTAGRLTLDGNDITTVPPNRRPVNLMFQSYALFPHMSVAANVAYGLEAEGRPREEIRRRVGEVLELTVLSDLEKRRPHELSGGQRQRVALARALVKKPRLLLLDEPLSALDRRLREQMQLELKRMRSDVGITFVVVTHDQEEALVMADRIAVLDRGRISQLGSPRDLYDRPENRFTARFLGQMNFLEGTLGNDGLAVEGLGLVRGVRPAAANGASGPACAAFRPERVTIAPAAAADGNAFAGTVEAVAYHGSGQSLIVRLEGARGTRIAVTRTAVDADARPVSAGEAVRLAVLPDHVRLLPGGPDTSAAASAEADAH